LQTENLDHDIPNDVFFGDLVDQHGLHMLSLLPMPFPNDFRYLFNIEIIDHDEGV